ncbi:MAG: hypothetical protein ACKVOE_05330 [Rickettsiales bacterium]
MDNSSNNTDYSRRFTFVTGNPRKQREYQEQCNLYGIGVNTMPRLGDEAALEATIRDHLFDPSQPKETQRGKPRFVLNEESDLYNAQTDRLSTRNEDMEPVYNLSTLTAYSLNETGEIVKKHYSAKVQGYLDLHRGGRANDVFDWDDVFVNSATGLTYHEQISVFGEKASARTQTIGDFIQRHLYYDTRNELNFGGQASTQTIDFKNSVADEITANALLKENTHLADWGLDRMLGHMLNDGIHTRAAINRRENTYWAPGLNAGLPNVPKRDATRELRFRFHDMMHYALVPVTDLIPTSGELTPELRRVQHATRMMSEAITVVMADMLFVETMEKSGIPYDYQSLPMYDRFYKHLDIPGDTREEKLTNLLRATVTHALTGDASLFRGMLKPGEEHVLADYEREYNGYYVGDHRWTDANISHMSTQSHLPVWRALVSDAQFTKANLTTVEGFADRLKARGADLTSYPDIVAKAFDEVMESHLLPRLREEPVALSNETRTSNAFRRYMIGQMAFYAKYQALDGIKERAERMVQQLNETEHFTPECIERMRKQFSQDVFKVQGAQLISQDDRHVYCQMYPLFPPFYLPSNRKESTDIGQAVAAIFHGGQEKPGSAIAVATVQHAPQSEWKIAI